MHYLRNMSVGDAQQQALAFLLSQITHIESEVYKIQYPEIQYPELIPVDTSAFEWAKSVTFFSMDQVGQATWLNHMANDIQRADVTREKFEQAVHMAGIGYGYTLEELGQAQAIPGTALTADRASAARLAYEKFVDTVALRGDTTKGWTGLINSPDVTRVDVPVGAGGDTTWASKTPDEIAADVNDALSGVYSESLQVEMADTVLLPVDEMTRIATRRLGDGSDTSILDFIKKNNVYTQITNRPLTIRAVRGLENGGLGGDVARMMVYRRDPRVIKLHLPMTHRFLPVWQDGPLSFVIPGIFRMGGVDIRLPGACRYSDGIADYAS